MREKSLTGAARYYYTSANGEVRMRSGVFTGALMAENVRSPFDYREPPTLDSDGDGSKPPPPRGLVKNPFFRLGNGALNLLLQNSGVKKKIFNQPKGFNTIS